MNQLLYSLRMHSSLAGNHLSGAEELVSQNDLPAATVRLLERARMHSRGCADSIRLSIDLLVTTDIEKGCLPALRTLRVASVDEGRRLARQLLQLSGVAAGAVEPAMRALTGGAAPGGQSMRGAMLVDCISGARLEADSARGVRVSRIGLATELCHGLSSELEPLQLNTCHVREALVLAGKVRMHPDILAELCWSDDPDYVAGYVCSRALGYLRIPRMKPVGETRGGRVFFLRPACDIEALVSWLETRPVLFDRMGALHQAIDWREYAPLVDS